jgi:hypothetical protein
MKEIDIENAAATANAQATYDDLMRIMALQLQSTDLLVEELVRRLDGIAKLQLGEFQDSDIINELTTRMSSIGAVICRASFFQEMAEAPLISYTSPNLYDCYNKD